jgi:hypothetical protein
LIERKGGLDTRWEKKKQRREFWERLDQNQREKEVCIGWVLVGRGEPVEWYEAGADPCKGT